MLMLSCHAYTEISPQPTHVSPCPHALLPPVTSGSGRVRLDLYVDSAVFLTALLALSMCQCAGLAELPRLVGRQTEQALLARQPHHCAPPVFLCPVLLCQHTPLHPGLSPFCPPFGMIGDFVVVNFRLNLAHKVQVSLKSPISET